MQAFIVHPGTDEEALEMASTEGIPGEEVPRVVLPSSTLTAIERVGIYRGMYLLRLAETLEVDYPAVQHFLGSEAFMELVRGYVHACPSRSYTLNRLGDHLPEYLRSANGVPRREFLHDLARLELAVTEVFDAPESPVLATEQIVAIPTDAWEQVRLKPIAAFRLLSFRYPVDAYLDSVKDESHDHPRARRKDTWLVVFRHNYVCRRLDLTRPAYNLLRDLTSGTPMGEAITSSVRKHRRRKGFEEDQLFRWFRDWVSEGIFQSIELPSS